MLGLARLGKPIRKLTETNRELPFRKYVYTESVRKALILRKEVYSGLVTCVGTLDNLCQ